MEKYECVCGYVYDPAEGDTDNGIEPGTSFDDLPDDWECPLCGASKESFDKVDQNSTCNSQVQSNLYAHPKAKAVS